MGYVSLQGRFYAAVVTNGVPGAFRALGNVPVGGVQLSADTFEHSESQTGNRLQDLRIQRNKRATISLTLEDWSKENLSLAFYGANSSIASGTVTNETLPSGLVAGDIARLAKPKASSIVVKDSAGTPATLTAGTHYEVVSADHGTIKILNPASFVQPFKVDYANAQVTNINMFTQQAQELWVKFDAVETIPGQANKLMEFYRVVFDPVADLGLIHDENGPLPLTGSVLYDSTKSADVTLGQFGRVVLL